jgi:ribosomal protein S27AE
MSKVWKVWSAGQDFPAQETKWEDALETYLGEVENWLETPENIFEAIEAVGAILIEKHHDYGEDNLKAFGELGILVRASDKVARLKNLIDKRAQVSDESMEDTWRDLAGYAIQGLIMLKMNKNIDTVQVYEKRKNRLIRGFCPDCGEGVLIRENFFDDRLLCSNRCGFITKNIYSLREDYGTVSDLIEYYASLPAVEEQK